MITVVIPTHDRAASMCRTLEALGRQEGAGEFEVVVVADGCSDDTVERVRACRPTYPLTLVEQPASGANEARMRGADVGRGELLVFLDDDVEPAPGCLAGHARAHRGRGAALVVGANLPVLDRATGMFAQGLRKWWVDLFRALGTPEYRKTYRDVLTGNMSIPRALFRALGGFDPAFRGAAEDWEFGLRAIRSGVRIVYAAAAASRHHEDPDLERYFRRVANEGRADAQLARMYPELTHSLPLGAPVRGSMNRVVRALAFGPGWLAAPFVAALRAQMSAAERLRMRRRWRKAFARMRGYLYWRGVSGQVGSREALCELVAAGAPDPVQPLRVDLRPGLAHAMASVDAARPPAVEVVHGEQHIGWVPAVPGAEPLRGGHLRAAVLGRLSGAVAAVLGAERALAAGRPAGETDPCARAERVTRGHLRTRIAELELAGGVEAIDATGCEHLRVLVRYRGLPLGWLSLHGGLRSAEELRDAVVQRFGWLMPRYFAAEAARPAGAELPAVSVVICTRDRPDHLERALAAATNLDYPRYEVIVVDNASATDETARVAAAFPVRYVREEVPGLDHARNRGVREAQHDIVAFTDDDGRADANWLRAIAEAFQRVDVAAVTGYVAPLELDTPAQHLFELVYGGMGHGLNRRSVRRSDLSRRELIQASGFGCGANMAFRRGVLEELGGFDPALDVGTPSGGGGDVDMLHRVLAAGHALVYEPAALVWHAHRREMDGLRRQLFDNGRSFGCYLLTCARNRTVGRVQLAGFALRTWLWKWLVRRTLRPGRLPRRLVLAELRGAVASPWYYRRSRVAARRRERPAPPVPPRTATATELPAEGAGVVATT